MRWSRFLCLFIVVSLLIVLTACEFPSAATPIPTLTLGSDQSSVISNQSSDIEALPTSTPVQAQTPTSQPPTATAVPPIPTPTYDPNLPEWTVLVYMNADNNLELAGLLDVNEMEAAKGSDRVTVLVQIDRAVGETAVSDNWTDTRRFRIQPDNDPDNINSELVAQLGEVNMGDPAVLRDFIVWGAANYPANRYALVVWDHGAGWNGIAFDGDTAEFGAPDFISLSDLDSALAQAMGKIGLDKFDVIGFDACLMGQLDVFQTVAPYADYAVGSEELTPGQGWNYAATLGQLAAAPEMDGAAFAKQITADFIDYYTRTEPDDFVTLSAVNLARLSEVTEALSQLAIALTGDLAASASAVGDARSGVEAFARVYANEFDRYAAVDLYHFASILAQRSPDEAVQAAAEAVMTGVETAVIANEMGSGFDHSGGIAIYFPRQAIFYDDTYAAATTNSDWDAFLQSYYAVGLAQLPPPELHLANGRGDVVGAQNPAYLDFEIVGREIDTVALLGGRYEASDEGTRRRLLEYDTLIPEPTFLPDGSRLWEWRDGVHEDFFIWDTKVTYLYDANEIGDFVVMWPAMEGENGRRLYTVQGRFRRADEETFTDGTFADANLVFDQITGQLMRVWGVHSDDSGAPAEITPEWGDAFQVASFYLDEQNEFVREAGPTLFFDEVGQLYFDWRPLPDGNYFAGLAAENVAGETAVAFTDLTVDNSNLLAGYDAYLDAYLGFQFLYPETWYRPVYTGTLLYTNDRTAATQVQITLYPNLEREEDARSLQNQTLNLFGPVDILYTEETAVAERRALQTAYGYEGRDGRSHTGIVLTFVYNGTGYVVDVDGLQEDEPATITAVAAIANSWQFIAIGAGLPPGQWAQIDLDDFTVAQPTDFAYQELGGWQRFSSDRYTFVALRTQPATLAASDVLAALLRDAGSDVDNFAANEPFRMLLGGAVWDRADFGYTLADGRAAWGFIMVKIEDGQEVVAWAEAPADTYNALERSTFLVMIADLALRE